MALTAGDWSIDRTTKDIRYIGGDHGVSPTYATVIEFHRWLQDLADDASSIGDDELDITDLDPSKRSTDNIITLKNGYNITDVEMEHLYDGSIIQGLGGTEVIYEGIVNFGNAGVVIQLHQDGAVLADDWWNSNSGLNADAGAGISHRFMIKVRDAGADIDGRKILGTTREIGKTYGEFLIPATSRGNNVLALSNSDDLNNATGQATIATWTTIANLTEGYALLDVDNTGVDEEYYSEWNKDTYTINQFYERMKWLTRDGSVSTLYGLNGELFRGITHEIVIDTPTGSFNAFEAVSWSGGAGQMLAIDSVTAGTKMWIQLLTGSAPIDNDVITGGTSAATATMNVTITSRALSFPFVGASTGSALIGAYGIGVEVLDLAATDKVFDLGNNPITPPNNITFSVNGVISSEDRILVAPWDGSTTDAEGNPAIDKTQLTTTAAIINGAAVTAIPIATAIPTDTPASGDLRVLLASGKYREIAYTSYTGSTFTIASTDFSGDQVDASSNLWIAYLDILATSTSESFTGVYLLDRDFVVIVRDGGVTPIKQFISSAANSSTGGSISVIRTSDE